MFQTTHLYVSINQPIQLEIIVILTKGIDERLSNFEPSNVKYELRTG